MLDRYISFWRSLDLSGPTFIHNADREFLDQPKFKRLTKGNECRIEGFDLHLTLLPAPYTGDLRQADIFLVYLNPGVGAADYHDEQNLAFRERLVKNIRQEFEGADYPFLSLDPAFKETGGYKYWATRGKALREIIEVVASKKTSGNIEKAQHLLANRIASIECIPYKSKKCAPGFLGLRSAQMSREFICDFLVQRAALGEVTIIVTRSVKRLGFDPEAPPKGVIVYPTRHARSASISPRTRGGKAILERLGCN